MNETRRDETIRPHGRVRGLAACLALALLASCGCGKGDSAKADKENAASQAAATQDPFIDVRDFMKEFKTSPKEAEKKYVGKNIRMKGVIKRLSENASFIKLETGTNAGSGACECWFSVKNAKELQALGVGGKVTFTGRCEELDEKNFFATFQDCELVKDEKASANNQPAQPVVVTHEVAAAKLRKGMTTAQVEALIGRPDETTGPSETPKGVRSTWCYKRPDQLMVNFLDGKLVWLFSSKGTIFNE